ncbi:MAG: hypothetical protein ACXVCE_05825 [Bacteriovorax sp.]
MTKTIAFLGLFLLTSTQSFAEDTVKATIGTQTYLCELTTQLSCKAVNQVQQKEMLLKKNAERIQIEDKDRGLSAEVSTSLDNNNVVYDLTLCSSQSCSMSTVTSDPSGNINQVMSGQYNITQKSFYVLGFFISTHANGLNLEDKILNSKYSLK